MVIIIHNVENGASMEKNLACVNLYAYLFQIINEWFQIVLYSNQQEIEEANKMT